MLEWVVTIIALLGVIGSILGFSKNIGSIQKQNEMEHLNMAKTIQEVKDILGNGAGHGLRQEVQGMKELCAGRMAGVTGEITDVRTRLSSQ